MPDSNAHSSQWKTLYDSAASCHKRFLARRLGKNTPLAQPAGRSEGTYPFDTGLSRFDVCSRG